MSLPGGNSIYANPSETGKLAASDPAEKVAGLPKHILSGYWHNWHHTSAVFMRLNEIASHFDVINIAFAVPSKAGNGEIVFTPCDVVSVDEFKSDIAHLQSWEKSHP